jgi:hypothetical protein
MQTRGVSNARGSGQTKGGSRILKLAGRSLSAWLLFFPGEVAAQTLPDGFLVEPPAAKGCRRLSAAMSAEVLGAYDSNLYNDTSEPVAAAGVDASLGFLVCMPATDRVSWASSATFASGHRDGVFPDSDTNEQRLAGSVKTGLKIPLFGGGGGPGASFPRLTLAIDGQFSVSSNPVLASQASQVNQTASDTASDSGASSDGSSAPFPTDTFSATHERFSGDGHLIVDTSAKTLFDFDMAVLRSYNLLEDEYVALRAGVIARERLARFLFVGGGYSFERKWKDGGTSSDGLPSVSDVHTVRAEVTAPLSAVIIKLSYALANSVTFGDDARSSIRHQAELTFEVPIVERTLAMLTQFRYVDAVNGTGPDSTRLTASLGFRLRFGDGVAPLERLAW